MNDESGIAVARLLKFLIIATVVGLLAFDFGATLFNRIQAGDVAARAATEAVIVYARGRDTNEAELRAREFTNQHGAEFVSLRIDRTAQSIAVTVRKTARVTVIDRFGPLAELTEVEVTESAPMR